MLAYADLLLHVPSKWESHFTFENAQHVTFYKSPGSQAWHDLAGVVKWMLIIKELLQKYLTGTQFPVLYRLSCKESMIYKQISLLFSSHPVKKYWPRQCIYLGNPTRIAAYVKLQLYRDLGRWKSFVYAPLFEGFVKKNFHDCCCWQFWKDILANSKIYQKIQWQQ